MRLDGSVCVWNSLRIDGPPRFMPGAAEDSASNTRSEIHYTGKAFSPTAATLGPGIKSTRHFAL